MRKDKKANRSAKKAPQIQQRRSIDIDGFPMSVPTTPLNASAWLQTPTRPRRWGDERRLYIDFCQGSRFVGAGILIVGFMSFGFLAFTIMEDAEWIAQLITGALGLFLTAFGSGLLLLPAWHEFDLENQKYRRHSWIAPVEIPKASIVGVQLLSGIEVIEETSEGDRVYWRTHQLLLVLFDKSLRRELLYSGADGDSIRAVAEQVALFLNLPLLIHQPTKT